VNGEDWVGGVDLNRNYAIAWENGLSAPSSQVYRGSAPFSEPETQAIRDFVLEHNFMYAISLHSGLEFILYPWGSTYDPAPDAPKFLEIAQEFSNLTGGTQYLMPDEMGQSYGLWMDWMYGKAGVLPFTLEVFRNETWLYAPTGVGPYPNTIWEGGWRWLANPFPTNIESVALRWLPVVVSITNRTKNEAFHNIAVETVESQRTIVGEGYSVELNVSLQNEGYFHEAFNLTIYVNATILQTQEITVSGGDSTSITFMWNTTGFAKGYYTIETYAETIPGETNTSDNNIVDGEILVTILGDVDGDKDVDIFDVVAIAAVYDSEQGELEYVPNYDIDGDGDIDIFDIVVVAGHYGDTWST